MSTYTLTTDLIADCMALIPQNLERFKEIGIFNFEKFPLRTLENFSDSLFDKFGKFLILTHCLRTIPEFEQTAPLPKRQYKKELNALVSERPRFKTIASATLHGQGEFPPSTLEELCESYKNVMSK